MKDAPPLPQSAEFAAALARFGRKPLRLEDGTLILTRRIAGLRLGLVSLAPLPDRSALDAAGLGGMPILLTPERPAPPPGALRLLTPVHHAALDLTPGAEALWSGLHQKWRNRVRRARAHGLTIRHRDLTPANGAWLLAADAAQQRARGYRAWPAALNLAYAAANPGQARIFTALHDGAPVAGLLLLCHGRAASYHVAHSTAQGRALSAHNLLLWSALDWLFARGASRLDLGAVDTEDAPGLARFKLGTGAALRPLGGTWLCWPPAARMAPFFRRYRRDGWT